MLVKGSSIPDGWAWPFRCSNCGRDYPSQGFPYRCPTCGGHFDLVDDLRYAPGSGRGLERYRTSFPLPPGTGLTSLGEGGTPLLEENLAERTVYLKCEHLNPTGSFKDRGTAVLVSALKAAGVGHEVGDFSRLFEVLSDDAIVRSASGYAHVAAAPYPPPLVCGWLSATHTAAPWP
ncbi:MAG: pyridoxal-phosphate dependent enzyme [Nitrospirae bacterium]|nr:pyridoxal-phosphate dependent enzyme [Nitrospirota bacterium]